MPSLPPGVDTLSRAAFFDALGEADREALRVCFRPKEFRAGEIVFEEGDPGGYMLVVGEGSLVATRSARGRHDEELGRIGPGELAGEMAFLATAPRCATVTAAEYTVAYAIDSDSLDVLRDNAPAAAAAVLRASLKAVGGRLRSLRDRLNEPGR